MSGKINRRPICFQGWDRCFSTLDLFTTAWGGDTYSLANVSLHSMKCNALCAKKVKVLEKSWKMITRLIEVRERCFCCCFCLGINPLFTLAAVEQFPCSARFFVSFSSVFARSMESWHLTKSSTIHHKLLDRFLCCPLFCNTWRHTALLVIGYFKCLLKIGQLE